MADYVNTEAEQLVVEVQVRDMARAKAFYQAIGFALISDGSDFVALSWEGSHLFLDLRADMPAPPAVPQANIRIMVPDVDTRWALVNEIGAPILDPIGDRDYGLRDFTFTDPDGFGLRFASLLDDAGA